MAQIQPNLAQIRPNWSKMNQKMVENHENYTGIFDIFDRRQTFNFQKTVENVPKYSTFDYRLSRYNFAKLYRTSKLLPERMALLGSPK